MWGGGGGRVKFLMEVKDLINIFKIKIQLGPNEKSEITAQPKKGETQTTSLFTTKCYH